MAHRKSVPERVVALAQEALDREDIEYDFFSSDVLEEVKRVVAEVSERTNQPGFVTKNEEDVTVYFYPNESLTGEGYQVVKAIEPEEIREKIGNALEKNPSRFVEVKIANIDENLPAELIGADLSRWYNRDEKIQIRQACLDDTIVFLCVRK